MLLSLLSVSLTAGLAAGRMFPSFGNPLPHGLGKRSAGYDYDQLPGEVLQIPVDHFNESDTRTYGNRYWVNSTYYEPGGPVFLFAAGEQDAQFLVPGYMMESAGPSSPVSLARRYGGLAVMIEHRYYGGLSSDGNANGSYPVPVNSSGYAADYSYLNLEQAMEDTVYFANHFQPAGLDDNWADLSPSQTPWIFIGGSYPGVQAAIARVRNPDIFFASWASSAPVQATVDMWTYWAQAEKSMTRNCSADYIAVTKYVDNILANGTDSEISDLKLELLTAASSGPGWDAPRPQVDRNASDLLSPWDVGSYLLTAFGVYQSFGFEASVLPFCDVMETMNQTEIITTDNGGEGLPIATEAGLAATYNISTAWSAFLTATSFVGYNNLKGLVELSADMSWSWQYCSEFGYYQASSPNNSQSIQSIYMSPEAFQEQCNQLFPDQNLPPTPNVDAINKYGGWDMNPSNVMFSNGQYDPWRSLSVSSPYTEIGAPGREALPLPPMCNTPAENGTVFGITYPNQVHAVDVRALFDVEDPYTQGFSYVGWPHSKEVTPFFAGLGLFELALDQWLPCFVPSNCSDSARV